MNQKKLDLFERDSLLMHRVIQTIQDRFNIVVSFEDLIKRPTMRNLAKFLESDLQFFMISKDLIQQDLEFTSSWHPSSVAAQSIPSFTDALLITGSTGFLGTHLLCDLYNRTKATLYVLIRAKSLTDARLILKKSFQKYELSDLSDQKRIVPVLGDLTKPLLGLGEEAFRSLSMEIDSIYHLGSFVHHIYDYQTLRATNVMGTKELIKLGMTNKKKMFYYVSSIVAALERDKEGWFSEEFPQEEDCGEVNGYAQTKWVCEKLLEKASKQGLPLLIFRPCNITGRHKDGICSPHKDHLLSLIKGCIQMGLAPDWTTQLNVMPVDFVSQFIAKASSIPFFQSKVFNIVNRHRLLWLGLIEWLNDYGYKIEVISDEEWCEKHLPTLTNENALFPLIGLYSNRSNPWLEINQTGDVPMDEKFRDQNGTHIFDLMDSSPPPVDAHLLLTYFQYLHKCGYLQQPGGQIQ